MSKLVYFFGGGKAQGHAGMKDLLGGKGANLAEMTNLGIPVPPGFTISTGACRLYFDRGCRFPDDLQRQVESSLKKLEKLQGKRFGDAADPLLVSVRSGAKFSMPGMMDTILNLGLNDQSVQGLAKKSGNERFALDSYRRFMQMFGDVVLEVPKHDFEELLGSIKEKKGVDSDADLSADDWKEIIEAFKKLVVDTIGESFPREKFVETDDELVRHFGATSTDTVLARGHWLYQSTV